MHTCARLVLVAAAIAAVADCYIDSDYCVANCVKKTPCAASEGFRNNVTEAEKQIILNLHNKLRSKVAKGQQKNLADDVVKYPRLEYLSTAANMRRLTWDDELADVAQQLANKCSFEAPCRLCSRKRPSTYRHRFWGVGQNVFMSTSSIQDSVNWEGVVQDWYNEVKYFHHYWIDNFRQQRFPVIAHFTQMVWAVTHKVGCGFISFPGIYGFNKYYICQYALLGNLDYESTYKKGTPCSQCPDGTACDQDSLCADKVI